MTQSNDLGSIVNVLQKVYRVRVNEAFKALASLNSGVTEPSPSYPGMLWWDTASNVIKIANSGASGWNVLASYNGTTIIPYHTGTAINNFSTVAHNFTANRAPLTTDNSTQGWSVGSFWFDVASSPQRVYQCVVATGSAVWRPLSIDRFSSLIDGFSLSGNALKGVRVNSGETGLEPFTTFTSEWQLLQTATLAGQSSVRLDSGTPSDYQEKRFRITNASPANNGVTAFLRLKILNAWQTGTTYHSILEIPTTGSNLLSGGASQTAIDITYPNALGNAAGAALTGEYYIEDYSDIITVRGSGVYLNTGGAPAHSQVGARSSLVSTVQGVELSVSAGNFAGGSISLYGKAGS